MDKKSIFVAVLISLTLGWYFFSYVPNRFDRELRYYHGREKIYIEYSLPYEFDNERINYVSRNELRQAIDEMILRDNYALLSAMRHEKVLIVTYYGIDGVWFYIWDAR